MKAFYVVLKSLSKSLRPSKGFHDHQDHLIPIFPLFFRKSLKQKTIGSPKKVLKMMGTPKKAINKDKKVEGAPKRASKKDRSP